MSAYQEAAAMAAATGCDHYVNCVQIDGGEMLLAYPYRDRLCCAIAHPDGTITRVVQGFSLAVALFSNSRQLGEQTS